MLRHTANGFPPISNRGVATDSLPTPCGCTFEGPDDPAPGRVLDYCPVAYRLSYMGASVHEYNWTAYCAHLATARTAQGISR